MLCLVILEPGRDGYEQGIRFTGEFKQDAVAQVVERGYAVSEVAERLGVSTKSLYTWKTQFSKSPRLRAEGSEQAAEIKRLKRELARVTEERNILKKATAYFARGCCQTNDCKHQIDGAIEIYALNS